MICIYQTKDKYGQPQWKTQIGIPKRNIQESPNPRIRDGAKRKIILKFRKEIFVPSKV